VRGVVVAHDLQFLSRAGGGDLLQEPQKLLAAVPGVAGVGHLAGGDLQGSEQAGRALPGVVVGLPPGMPLRIGRIGWLRSSAWHCDFVSMHST
jgi:hypothetical protein